MEEETKKSPNWGGKRQGAGRKKVLEGQTHKISTAVSEDVYNWIVSEAAQDGITMSAFISRTLSESMKHQMEMATLLSDVRNWIDEKGV